MSAATAGAGIVVLFIIAALAVSPVLTILSVNHLFGVGWAVDFPTYFSLLWLTAFVGGLIRNARDTEE